MKNSELIYNMIRFSCWQDSSGIGMKGRLVDEGRSRLGSQFRTPLKSPCPGERQRRPETGQCQLENSLSVLKRAGLKGKLTVHGDWGQMRVDGKSQKWHSLGTSLVVPWWTIACQCRGSGFDPWSRKIPHATGQWSPCVATTEDYTLELTLLNQRSHGDEKPTGHKLESRACSLQLEKAPVQRWRQSEATKYK